MKRRLILCAVLLLGSRSLLFGNTNEQQRVETGGPKGSLRAELQALKAFRPSSNVDTQVERLNPVKDMAILLLACECSGYSAADLKKKFPHINQRFKPTIANLDGDEDIEVIIDTSDLWGGDVTEFYVVDRGSSTNKVDAPSVHRKLVERGLMDVSARDVDCDGKAEIVLTRNDSIVSGVNEARKVERRKYVATIVFGFDGKKIDVLSPYAVHYVEQHGSAQDR